MAKHEWLCMETEDAYPGRTVPWPQPTGGKKLPTKQSEGTAIKELTEIEEKLDATRFEENNFRNSLLEFYVYSIVKFNCHFF